MKKVMETISAKTVLALTTPSPSRTIKPRSKAGPGTSLLGLLTHDHIIMIIYIFKSRNSINNCKIGDISNGDTSLHSKEEVVQLNKLVHEEPVPGLSNLTEVTNNPKEIKINNSVMLNVVVTPSYPPPSTTLPTACLAVISTVTSSALMIVEEKEVVAPPLPHVFLYLFSELQNLKMTESLNVNGFEQVSPLVTGPSNYMQTEAKRLYEIGIDQSQLDKEKEVDRNPLLSQGSKFTPSVEEQKEFNHVIEKAMEHYKEIICNAVGEKRCPLCTTNKEILADIIDNGLKIYEVPAPSAGMAITGSTFQLPPRTTSQEAATKVPYKSWMTDTIVTQKSTWIENARVMMTFTAQMEDLKARHDTFQELVFLHTTCLHIPEAAVQEFGVLNTRLAILLPLTEYILNFSMLKPFTIANFPNLPLPLPSTSTTVLALPMDTAFPQLSTTSILDMLSGPDERPGNAAEGDSEVIQSIEGGVEQIRVDADAEMADVNADREDEATDN
ncbi:hypothetical protein C8Q75DRAFT_736479 [Abortiporus biennis]|nr:hypothetical protein C8Q75DRAFT_736479 [Abortiporus biennis]